MALGYDGRLYLLAFDHHGSLQTDLLKIDGKPTPEQLVTMVEIKRLVFEGMLKAIDIGLGVDGAGVVIDEPLGVDIPERARQRGLTLAMTVEMTAHNEGFEYGAAFGDHIEQSNPDFSKVKVRYNPDDPDGELNQRKLERLKELSDWLHGHERKYLFELLAPATDEQLAKVGGDENRYQVELRPELVRRAIAEAQAFGIEVDVWKLDGVDAREDAEMLVGQARSGEGRAGVSCVLRSGGISTSKLEEQIRMVKPIDGFGGFVLGRSIWWDAVEGHLARELNRDAASTQIAENYLHFIRVYEGREAHH